MSSKLWISLALCALAFATPSKTWGQSVQGSRSGVTDVHREPPSQSRGRPITFQQALRRALEANPKLEIANRDIGAATGRRIQAGVLPNPEIAAEADNVAGSGAYRGVKAAETTLQISQLFELGGKREARIAVGTAGVDAAYWQREAARLELLSETAVTFFTVLSAQARVEILDEQIAILDRLFPLLQRRVDAGASSPAETARAQAAIDLAHIDRDRAVIALSIGRRELAAAMGGTSPDFSRVVGDMTRMGRPPSLAVVLRSLDQNPQLARFNALRAQRRGEFLLARLKAVPDLRVGVGWRHYSETNDNAARITLSMPIPVFDQNEGGIREAQEVLARTEAESRAAKAVLVVVLGRAYDTFTGAELETDIIRRSALPNAKRALELIESGYSQGRYTLLEILDAQATATQTALRGQDALLSYYSSLATIEALSGAPVTLSREVGR